MVVQTTYNIERIRGTTSHRGSKEFLFPGGAECEDRGEVTHPGSLNLLKPLVERVRTRGSSKAGREADRMDVNYVRTKTTHRTNAR